MTNVAYVDGSFNPENRRYGYGVLLFDQYGRLHERSFSDDNPSLAIYRNVAGEILGAKEAVQFARFILGMIGLTIVYDYDGIGKWPLKEWKPKNSFTKEYYLFMEKMILNERMRIHFYQIKGHSGDPWNEKADRLAKEAVGIL